MSDWSRYLARVVHFHRKRSGLSQQRLAQLAGVGKTVVFDIEHAKTTVQLATLLKVCNVLNIHLQLQSPLLSEFENEGSHETR